MATKLITVGLDTDGDEAFVQLVIDRGRKNGRLDYLTLSDDEVLTVISQGARLLQGKAKHPRKT